MPSLTNDLKLSYTKKEARERAEAAVGRRPSDRKNLDGWLNAARRKRGRRSTQQAKRRSKPEMLDFATPRSHVQKPFTYPLDGLDDALSRKPEAIPSLPEDPQMDMLPEAPRLGYLAVSYAPTRRGSFHASSEEAEETLLGSPSSYRRGLENRDTISWRDPPSTSIEQACSVSKKSCAPIRPRQRSRSFIRSKSLHSSREGNIRQMNPSETYAGLSGELESFYRPRPTPRSTYPNCDYAHGQSEPKWPDSSRITSSYAGEYRQMQDSSTRSTYYQSSPYTGSVNGNSVTTWTDTKDSISRWIDGVSDAAAKRHRKIRRFA